MRKIKQVNEIVSIHYSSEYQEYQVRIKGNPDSTYFTDDKADAFGTAEMFIKNDWK